MQFSYSERKDADIVLQICINTKTEINRNIEIYFVLWLVLYAYFGTVCIIWQVPYPLAVYQ
jgi:hypothetical protein